MEEENTAVETEELDEPDFTETEEEVAEPQEETEGEPAEEEEPAEPRPEDKPGKQPQTKEQNDFYQKLRHKEEEKRAYERGKLEAFFGMKNPYTDEEMTDEHDVREFLQMREAEKSGLDPVADYAAYQKTQARQQAKRDEETAKIAEQSQKDVETFAKTHPEVDLAKLMADEDFLDYASGKLGTKPLGDIYDRFIRLAGGYEQRASKQARKMVARSLASPGALTGGGRERAVTVENMSDEAFEKMLERAKRGDYTKYS